MLIPQSTSPSVTPFLQHLRDRKEVKSDRSGSQRENENLKKQLEEFS